MVWPSTLNVTLKRLLCFVVIRSNILWQRPETRSCSTRARWQMRQIWGGVWPIWRNLWSSMNTWRDRSLTRHCVVDTVSVNWLWLIAFNLDCFPVLASFVTSAFILSEWRWGCILAQLTQLFCHHQALAEFEMYRQRMEDSQLCTEAQHTQRVVSMSREVRPYAQRTHMHWLGKGLQQPCKIHWLRMYWMEFNEFLNRTLTRL